MAFSLDVIWTLFHTVACMHACIATKCKWTAGLYMYIHVHERVWRDRQLVYTSVDCLTAGRIARSDVTDRRTDKPTSVAYASCVCLSTPRGKTRWNLNSRETWWRNKGMDVGVACMVHAANRMRWAWCERHVVHCWSIACVHGEWSSLNYGPAAAVSQYYHQLSFSLAYMFLSYFLPLYCFQLRIAPLCF